MIVLPHKALQLLTDVANSNVNQDGQHVESLAFLLAVKQDARYIVTDVVLPTQSASGAFVEDHGIDEQDTAAFLQSLCSHDPTKSVLGWFHTHVRGTPLMLSAVDCHTQFLYETTVFSGIKAFVLQVPTNALDCYELTALGKESIRLCTLQFPHKATTQHLKCFQPTFYQSLKHLLVNVDAPVLVIDARNSQPFTQPVGLYEKFSYGNEPLTTQTFKVLNELSFKCDSCGKTFANMANKRKHLNRTKCIGTISSNPALFEPVTDVQNFLQKACTGSSVKFPDENEALQHFSRSSCKKWYKNILNERKRVKQREYYNFTRKVKNPSDFEEKISHRNRLFC